MKKKLVYILVTIILIAICFSTGVVVANETGMTFVGEDEIETFNLDAPAKRVESVYRQGDDKVFIKCSGTLLIPIGEGTSMLPMVTEGHLVLVTTDFDFDEIQVGDFIVVDGSVGRYFHQVVEVKKDGEGFVFTTRGINRTENDIFPIFGEDVIGVALAVFW